MWLPLNNIVSSKLKTKRPSCWCLKAKLHGDLNIVISVHILLYQIGIKYFPNSFEMNSPENAILNLTFSWTFYDFEALSLKFWSVIATWTTISFSTCQFIQEFLVLHLDLETITHIIIFVCIAFEYKKCADCHSFSPRGFFFPL